MSVKLDMDKIARGLGAERRGAVKAGGGYSGAVQRAAEVEARFRAPPGGGRAPDPAWTERRLVPMDAATLEKLEALAGEVARRGVAEGARAHRAELEAARVLEVGFVERVHGLTFRSSETAGRRTTGRATLLRRRVPHTAWAPCSPHSPRARERAEGLVIDLIHGLLEQERGDLKRPDGDATPRDLSGEGLGVELRVALGARDPRRLRESLDAAADWMEEGAATAPLALHVAAGWATLAITDPATRAEAAAEASQAVARGLAAESNDPLLRRCLRAMSLLVAAVREGRAPDPSLLARAGLHDLVARLDGPADPLTLLRYADPPRAAAWVVGRASNAPPRRDRRTIARPMPCIRLLRSTLAVLRAVLLE